MGSIGPPHPLLSLPRLSHNQPLPSAELPSTTALSSSPQGVTFYALLISNFEVIVQNANHSRINLREKLQTANDYMKVRARIPQRSLCAPTPPSSPPKAKHIPSHIREKVRSYFKIQASDLRFGTKDAV